jgi:hypothetical protein
MQASKKHLGESFAMVLLLATACAGLVTLMAQMG